MTSGEIHILPTAQSPEFLFDPQGIIKISGRGLSGPNSEVMDQILNWIDEYIESPPENTYVYLSFEYLNSFSTTILVSILRKLILVLLQSKKLAVQWIYDEDDEDILERGEYISESLNIPIKFIVADYNGDL